MLSPQSELVMKCAGDIVIQQSCVPTSPAEITADGKVVLCLAAAVAKAGFLLSGRMAEADDLTRELARTKSKDRLRRAFVDLGWTVADCDVRLGLNDSTPDAVRKSKVLAYLQSV